MAIPRFTFRLHLFLILICVFSVVAALAQVDVKPTPPSEPTENLEDDVLKISTDLIQTGVAVFDKKGQFVNNLKREDFELQVDGKPISISFFEQKTTVKNGDSEAKIESNSAKSAASNSTSTTSAGSGRNIIFVVDDFHLSFDSHYRVKKLISKFVEQEMLPDDTVAVVSPTGKIGFLQQFTNNKTVLQAAVERLIFSRDRSANDRSLPPMTEYEALLISQFDREVTDIFAAQELGTDIESKRETVRGRARSILTQAAAINRGTYSTLEQAVRSSARLPGRKVVFFISDGFLLDQTNTDSAYLMRRITDAAARTNTVIYSFDAKGLEAGFPEGTTGSSPSVAYRVQSDERSERQDGLNLLADETGGRFILNTNDLQTGLTKSLEEATQHYLLAWEPISETGKSEKFRKIEVSVKNRPELKVRVQGGYFDENLKADSDEKNKTKNKKDKSSQTALPIPEQQLNAAVSAPIPARALPTALTVNYLDIPNEGMLLATALQIKSEAVEFTPEGERSKANVDVLGIVYDSSGKRAGYFRELLTVDAAASALSKSERQDIYHNYQTKLKPGLYQVRVAARDVKSGRVGSAASWIEIPDLSSRRLALSSLIVSEKKTDAKINEKNAANIEAINLPVAVDRRFARTSQLRYIVFIYNAARGKTGANQPDVTLQTQILRGNNVVVESPARPVSTEGQDTARLPYAAEISLSSLPAGRYELQVMVQDRAAKSSSIQRVNFEVK